MSTLQLIRTKTGVQGTFGKLVDETGMTIALTCERPANNNQPMSCIPTGDYSVVTFNSPSKGKDFLVQGVPHRSMIEIHKGNTIKDTQGCILVGKTKGSVDGLEAVLGSAVALEQLLTDYPTGFVLTITEEYI